MAALAESSEEKLCYTCREYWPADKEFFFADQRYEDGLSRNCKCCYWEKPCVIRKNAKKAQNAKPLRSAWQSLFEGAR